MARHRRSPDGRRRANTPLVPASNFLLGGERGYARGDGTPTWEALEDVVGRLEEGRAVAFASGMAAVAAVFARLPSAARVVLPTDGYQGVIGLALEGQRRHGWTIERLALEDTAAWVHAAGTADSVWLESPSNPLLTVADLAAIGAAPRKPGAILAVDNTFAMLLESAAAGLRGRLHQSATKLIGGHSDLLAGIATTKDAAMFDALTSARMLRARRLARSRRSLAVRGARTLALRLERAQATAMTLATRLEADPRVAKVRYPGRPPTRRTRDREAAAPGFGDRDSVRRRRTRRPWIRVRARGADSPRDEPRRRRVDDGASRRGARSGALAAVAVAAQRGH